MKKIKFIILIGILIIGRIRAGAISIKKSKFKNSVIVC